MNARVFHVYILSSLSRVLYVGVTNDLSRRVYEHKQGAVPGFTARYNVRRLVYFEEFAGALSAIAREKQLKRWRRGKKVCLIESSNPLWRDLSEGWYDE
jgi:putative endonuclease